MPQLHAQETLLHFAMFLQVRRHVLVLGRVVFVGEVHDELRISLDDDALNPQGGGGSEPCEEAFVLRYVVGDLVALLEAELYGVEELVSCWRSEDGASPPRLVC